MAHILLVYQQKKKKGKEKCWVLSWCILMGKEQVTKALKSNQCGHFYLIPHFFIEF